MYISSLLILISVKLLESLENAWMNEKFAPEILPHQTDILDLMLDQIVHMEANIAQLNRHDLRLIAHKMELARIRFIISSYLRCRLDKIEKYAVDILAKEDERDASISGGRRLSPQEKTYAESYVTNLNSHFNQVALKNMPLNLQEPSPNQVVRPNLTEHVFLKANVPGNRRPHRTCYAYLN